ncbi:MAG: DUF3786 domain-containing protein [Eubacteriales bacterium]|nr:DUF3786 domain-containing protein [Eubacteriales bacterium]
MEISKPQNQSNYDKVIEEWRLRFLKMDQEALIEKFQLESDEMAVYLTYFNYKMRIDRFTGVITYVEEPQKIAGFNTCMDIYNLFHYSIDIPVASGILVPFRQVKRVYPFEAAYKRTVLKTLQETFSGHVEELKNACEKLGGKPLPQGDVGYQLSVYPFLDIAVYFWDADDEFEAQANMLFDSNITDFLHEENVVCVAADAVYYLTEAAGLDAKEIYASSDKR